MESDQHKLFVGGISRETNEETLKEHFSKYGVVLGTVVAKDKATGAPRCFGFVRFSDADSADKALRNTHVILGRKVDVKKAIPKFEQHQHGHEGSTNNNNLASHRTKKIFVGGLSSSVSEEDFKKYFERFGRITDVVVMHDSVTHRPRGFGFVTFDSEDSVESVVQNNFHELNNKLVEVKRAIPKEGIQVNNSNQNSKFGVVRGCSYNNFQPCHHPLDSSGYGGMYVPYTPVLGYNGFQGFSYPVDLYGFNYPMHSSFMPWNNPMMLGAGSFSIPATGNVAYMNHGAGVLGTNPGVYNSVGVSRAHGKPNQVIDGEGLVNSEVDSPDLDKTSAGAHREQESLPVATSR